MADDADQEVSCADNRLRLVRRADKVAIYAAGEQSTAVLLLNRAEADELVLSLAKLCPARV